MTAAVEFRISRLYGDVRAVDGLALAYAMEFSRCWVRPAR